MISLLMNRKKQLKIKHFLILEGIVTLVLIIVLVSILNGKVDDELLSIPHRC